MNKIRLAWDYLNYLLTSKTKYSVHSPFVFRFITEVLESKRAGRFDLQIEQFRKALLCNHQVIVINDFGAGSSINSAPERKISDIAGNSLKSKKYGRLLHRIAAQMNPGQALELGTSLGITSMYLSTAMPEGKLTTIEGSEEIARLAGDHFDRLNCSNIHLLTGHFDKLLPLILKDIPQLDLVFFDGNHQKKPTLNYFEQCLGNIHNDSVFIFDDIYWSAGMKEAWKEIKDHPNVTLTIDLFFLGLVFFRKEQEKQHFKLRF